LALFFILLSSDGKDPQSAPEINDIKSEIMKRRILHNTCILVLYLAGLSPLCAQSQTKERYAIKNVNVIPMDQERIIPGQTVIVENGVITKIGPNINPGKNVAIIDGGGKWLIPGFFDMHVHFFYEQG
jgi:hypothetical protein